VTAASGKPGAKPPWLRRRLPGGPRYETLRTLLGAGGLHTVCQEALCPNIWQCFDRGTATFLILGDRCTRDCRFCAVGHGHPGPVDADEPRRVAAAAAAMGLAHVVVTSVTRDDLPDGGAQAFARTIAALRAARPQARIEVLIPDFQGSAAALAAVVNAGPDVLNHNIETVPRLYPLVRPQADYRRSLTLLATARQMAPGLCTKSGLMLGLGEDDKETDQVLHDLVQVGCRILTMGQYLQPGPDHLPVVRFVAPETFEAWRAKALGMGFAAAACGPFVRSSYEAGELFARINPAEQCGGASVSKG
jgi:lipoic acid synthetase